MTNNNNKKYIDDALLRVESLVQELTTHVDESPELLSQMLLQHAWPQWLQPFPSATILSFSPEPNQLQACYTVPKHTVVSSNPVGELGSQVACRFRTVASLSVYPICLSPNLRVKQKNKFVNVVIECNVIGDISFSDIKPVDLVFYLSGSISQAAHYFWCLLEKLVKVEIVFPEHPTCNANNSLKYPYFSSCHWKLDESLLPLRPGSFSSVNLWLDYFCLPQKYMFLKLNALSQINWPEGATCFLMKLVLDNANGDIDWGENNIFQLNCVPAVNVFPETAEPIRASPDKMYFPIVVNLKSRSEMDVFSVENVVGIDAYASRCCYPAMHSLRMCHPQTRYYSVLRNKIVHDKNALILLMGGLPLEGPVTISCDVLAHNGDIPHRYLSVGTDWLISECSDFFQISNVIPPSKVVPSPFFGKQAAALMAQWARQFSDFFDLQALQQLISLYDWVSTDESSAQCHALTSMVVNRHLQFYKGAAYPTIDIFLTVECSHFSSVGEVYFFVRVLYQFLFFCVPINHKLIMHVEGEQCGRKFAWNMT